MKNLVLVADTKELSFETKNQYGVTRSWKWKKGTDRSEEFIAPEGIPKPMLDAMKAAGEKLCNSPIPALTDGSHRTHMLAVKPTEAKVNDMTMLDVTLWGVEKK